MIGPVITVALIAYALLSLFVLWILKLLPRAFVDMMNRSNLLAFGYFLALPIIMAAAIVVAFIHIMIMIGQ